jgi:hypothetical protein
MRIASSFGWLVVAATLGGQVDEAAGGSGKPVALFYFTEGSDTLSFFPPQTVRLVRGTKGGTKVCQTDLSDQDNLWGGRDVEQAYRNPDVQKALGATTEPYDADTSARLTAGDRSIAWAAKCDKCLQPSEAIKNLYTVLHGVMVNRRLLCK